MVLVCLVPAPFGISAHTGWQGVAPDVSIPGGYCPPYANTLRCAEEKGITCVGSSPLSLWLLAYVVLLSPAVDLLCSSPPLPWSLSWMVFGSHVALKVQTLLADVV